MFHVEHSDTGPVRPGPTTTKGTSFEVPFRQSVCDPSPGRVSGRANHNTPTRILAFGGGLDAVDGGDEVMNLLAVHA